MRWEDERYVRLYTRDTIGWKLLPWQAKCVIPLVMRKLDRAGILDLGGAGLEGVAALIDMPAEVALPGIAAAIEKGVFVLNADALVMPHFLEAQECQQSDAIRQRESRERRRAEGLVRKQVNGKDVWLTPESDSGPVTAGHNRSQQVTPSLAVPSRAFIASVAETATSAPEAGASSLADRRKKPRESDPRHAPLKARMEEAYLSALGEVWKFDGSDAKALTSLLARASDEEILDRWMHGLTAEFHCVRRVRELESKWGHHSQDRPKTKDVRKGVTRAEDFEHPDQVGPNGTIDIAF